MGKLRALVVGVSNYTRMKENDLPFCRNDISAICDALVQGLKFERTEKIHYQLKKFQSLIIK